MRTSRILAIVAVLSAGLATSSIAQPIGEAFTYQGQLLEAGAPADGQFDFEFRLFDAATGGSQLGSTITRSGAMVAGGLFTQTLDFGNQFNNDRVWLEIRVGPNASGASSVLPRQELTATPFATRARQARIAEFALDSGTTLQDAYDNGATVMADAGPMKLVGSLEIGDAQTAGALDFFGTLGTSSFLGIGQDSVDGGRILIRDEAGIFLASLEADGQGAGSFMQLIGGDSPSGGFIWDGNATGPDAGGVLTLLGPDSNFAFNTNVSGNPSVLFPNDAISALETFNEPGIATRNTNLLGAAIMSANSSLYQRTIIVPADGFVVAICTAEVFIDHVTGLQTTLELGLATQAGVFQRGLEYTFEYASDNASDAVLGRIPTLHATFPVSAGSTTIHLNGRTSGGGTGTDISDIELTLMYFPTAYGAVDGGGNRPGGNGGLDDQTRALQPGVILSAADIQAERDASIGTNQDRILEELAQMRARMAELEASLRDTNDGAASE